MVLVDTSVWIDFFNGHPSPEADSLAQLIESDAPIALTGIVLTEILLGLKSEAQAKKIRSLLTAFEFIGDASRADYEEAARIYRDCRSRGHTIRSTIDCLIAQISLSRDLWLLTKDRDFEAIARFFPLKLWKPRLTEN